MAGEGSPRPFDSAGKARWLYPIHGPVGLLKPPCGAVFSYRSCGDRPGRHMVFLVVYVLSDTNDRLTVLVLLVMMIVVSIVIWRYL